MPEPDCFSGYSDAPFGEQVFDITVAEVDAIAEPDGVRDDVGRISMALVRIHAPILTNPGS